MFIPILQYYWPRILVALLFVGASALMISRKKQGIDMLISCLILFFISCPVVSIIVEIFISNSIAIHLIPLFKLDFETSRAVYSIFLLVIDLLTYILPIYIYHKVLGERLIVAGTIYVEFLLQDRFAQVISFSALSYFFIYIIDLAILGLIHKKDLEYISNHNDFINWKPVFFYYLALYILMDICYGAAYFFPALDSDTPNIQTIWLATVVILAAFSGAAFSKLNVIVSKENEKKIRYMRKFQENQTDIIRDFATISEAKSGETGQHIRRVSEYTAILARGIIKDSTDIMYIKVASMMHDIGKLMIPNEIIEKPGKLSPEEYETIKTHSEFGDSLLSHSEGEIMTIARTIAYEHHERWDGHGYPRGIKGDSISIYAQIVSVADVYDALTSKRSYKEPWDPLEARVEIIRQKGHQFSPKVVDNFIDRYDEIEEIRKKYAD